MSFETLTRTPSVAGNRRTFTISQWVKLNVAGLNQKFYSTAAGAGTSAASFFWMIEAAGNLDCGSYYSAGGGWQNYVQSAPLLRDHSAWYHVLCAVDTTQSTSTNRIKVYVNNVLQPLAASAYPTQNFQYDVNNTTTQYIGSAGAAGSDPKSEWCNTNMSDFYLIDGLALTPTTFGKYDTRKANQWVAKHPTVIANAITSAGGFGTNGFYLPLSTPYVNGSSDVYNLGNAKFIMGCTAGNTSTFDVNIISGSTVGTLTYNSTGGAINNGPYASGFTQPTSTSSTSGASGWLTGDNSVFTSWTTGRTWAAFVKTSDTGTRSGSSWQVKVPVFGDYRNSVYGAFGVDDSKVAFGNASIYRGTTNIADGTWHHVALTCSSGTKSSAIFKLYVDGKYEATVPASILDQTSLDSMRLDCVGFHYMYTGVVSPTAIDGAQVYYYEMSNDQINALYKGTTYTVGYDYSGNNAHWTSSGSLQVVKDSITNNFATMNSNAGFDGAHTMGGLIQTGMNDCLATMGFKSGKFYWEHKILQYGGSGAVLHFGITSADYNQAGSGINSITSFIYRNDGNVYRNNGNGAMTSWSGSDVTGGIASGVNDIIAIAVNLTTTPASITLYKNGTQIYSYTFTFDNNNIGYIIPYVRNNGGCSSEQNFGQGTFVTSNSGNGYTDANGKGKFQYAPPSGFLALCEDNLVDSTNAAALAPQSYFKTVTWFGNGSSSRAITGAGFRPDLVWAKCRNNSYQYMLIDSVRGPNKVLHTNSNAVEDVNFTYGYLTSFDSDGFTMQSGSSGIENLNANTYSYSAWCWGGSGSTTISGTTNHGAAYTTKYNNTSGLSIMTYDGSGTANHQIPHGLDKTPSFTILKCRTTTSTNYWVYWFSTNNARSRLDIADVSYIDGLNGIVHNPTYNLINHNDVTANASSNTYVQYSWKQVDGFSKFGKWVGNGSTNGPFVYCGFRPAFIIFKRIDAGGNDWRFMDSVRDATNPATKALYQNATTNESGNANDSIDFLSNGFKIRASAEASNASGSIYYYAAFAESPQDFANAR